MHYFRSLCNYVMKMETFKSMGLNGQVLHMGISVNLILENYWPDEKRIFVEIRTHITHLSLKIQDAFEIQNRSKNIW